MNDKRFWKMETFQGFCDIFDNDKTICSVRIEYANALIDLLNSLAEENEQLKNFLKSITITKGEFNNMSLFDVYQNVEVVSDNE